MNKGYKNSRRLPKAENTFSSKRRCKAWTVDRGPGELFDLENRLLIEGDIEKRKSYLNCGSTIISQRQLKRQAITDKAKILYMLLVNNNK